MAAETDALAIQYHAQGERAAAQGDWQEAAGHFELALRLKPDLVEACNDLGMALQRLGEWQKAIPCYQQAIRAAPTFIPAHNNLGNALRGIGKLPEAVAAFEEALRLDPENADILFNLGNTYQDYGALNKAVDCYRKALQLRADYVEVSNNLATAYKEQGRLDEAVRQLRETLTLKPDHALSYSNLSELAAEGRCALTPDEVARMRAIFSAEGGAPEDRSACGFALGAVLAKQGAYDEAFACYRKANELKKGALDKFQPPFHAANHDRLIDRIIAMHDRSFFERTQKWGTLEETPIFIIGMPRSGSTLIEQILASHPAVFGAGEIHEIYRFAPDRANAPNALMYSTSPLPNMRAARTLATDYLRYLADIGKGAPRVAVKTLDNFLHLGMIAVLFPRARIVHCTRDALDVCLSCYFQNFHGVDFAWTLEDIGAYYCSYQRLMAHWKAILPMPIYEVAYERLIDNQETMTRALIDHCGLEWDDRCLKFFETRRNVQTASAVQVRKPISGQAVGRWRKYQAHLGPLFKALGGGSNADAR